LGGRVSLRCHAGDGHGFGESFINSWPGDSSRIAVVGRGRTAAGGRAPGRNAQRRAIAGRGGPDGLDPKRIGGGFADGGRRSDAGVFLNGADFLCVLKRRTRGSLGVARSGVTVEWALMPATPALLPTHGES